MRYILFIGILSVFIVTTVDAKESTDTKNYSAPSTYLSIETGGIMYDIMNGTYKKVSPEKFTINASAYTAAADECGKSDGITASGKMVKQNHTLACPRGYEFGTKIHIEGMGTYICEDRGGAIKENRFDIYMETKSEAFAFGRRSLVAYVVK